MTMTMSRCVISFLLINYNYRTTSNIYILWYIDIDNCRTPLLDVLNDFYSNLAHCITSCLHRSHMAKNIIFIWYNVTCYRARYSHPNGIYGRNILSHCHHLSIHIYYNRIQLCVCVCVLFVGRKFIFHKSPLLSAGSVYHARCSSLPATLSLATA